MTPFSDFFRNASHEEKEKLFLEVAKQASEDQKKLMTTPLQKALERLEKIAVAVDMKNRRFVEWTDLQRELPEILKEVEEATIKAIIRQIDTAITVHPFGIKDELPLSKSPLTGALRMTYINRDALIASLKDPNNQL